ncbi:MAG: hypothetical protein HY277_04180, partial [Ignavibacteriales bacterium]|nr:hypothetical protein [Ignavibacteriales bacterium]
MVNTNFRVSWFGIALIVMGGALLLDRLHIIDVEFSTIFWSLIMVLGLITAAQGFSQSRRGKVFWGTVWFLFGLFFFLRSLDSIEIHRHMFVPATLLIVGAGFLMMFIQNVRDWYYLIPATILCGIGGLFILADYGYLYRWEVWEAVHLYWPIALILVGIGIILRGTA